MKKVLIGLAVVVIAFVILVATRPATFTVERSIDIDSPRDIPYGMVSDFHQWDAWSPWEKLDPNMKKTYGGTPSAVGSSYEWVGNDDVGKGKMTLTAAEAPESLSIELVFLEPWAATNQTGFTFAQAGEKTKVTWRMEGNNDFVGKAFGLFMDMDSMIGADFEKGLASLKTMAETEAEKRKTEVAGEPATPAAAVE